ncbi:hypothetical protein AGLY_006787 [Aphis glycines]|uniref:Uncharacterized protein n=1 Tax=Aphis glycines TaxID=307491 RepID=A0A6G0TQC8_APHGL|nr:hypothetical protein AGLY_006787 [Aphis glycines]
MMLLFPINLPPQKNCRPRLGPHGPRLIYTGWCATRKIQKSDGIRIIIGEGLVEIKNFKFRSTIQYITLKKTLFLSVDSVTTEFNRDYLLSDVLPISVPLALTVKWKEIIVSCDMIVVTTNTSGSQRIKIGIDYPEDKKCEYVSFDNDKPKIAKKNSEELTRNLISKKLKY